MKIAILGTGIVGQTIASRLIELGHEVIIGSRNIEQALASDKPNMAGVTLSQWHAQNPKVKLANFNEATANSEFIINATNGGGSSQALEMAGENNLNGKVLLDIANPLDFSKGMPPSLFVCNTDSLGEQIQQKFPKVKVVKSLNTMNCYIMVNPVMLPEDHNVFMSGNDADAKEQVSDLLQSFGWKNENIIDLGDITSARATEQLLPIWLRLWGTLQNGNFNFKVVIGNAS